MVLNWFPVLQMKIVTRRETAHAAGYDLKVAERTVIALGEIVWFDRVNFHMQPTEVLYPMTVHQTLTRAWS